MDRILFEKIQKIKNEEDIKVLYVEDGDNSRLETIQLLSHFFNNIDEAKNGLEGFEKFKKYHHDIVITDINMPKMDGITMIKKIKEIDKKVPILIITAFSNTEYLMESIKIGVYDYIIKPIDIDQLMESVYRVLEKTILRKERDRALELLNQYKQIIDESFTVTKTDPKGIITYANEKFCQSSGYSKDELIGKPHSIVRHPDMPKAAFENLWKVIQSKKIWKGLVKNKTKDGKASYFKAHIAPILDEKKNIIEYIAVRENVTDLINPRKVLQDKINELKNPVLVLCKIENYEDLETLYSEKMLEQLQDKFMKKAKKIMPKDFLFDFTFELGEGEFAFIKDYKISDENINYFLNILRSFQEKIRNTPIKVGQYEYEIELLISFTQEKDHMYKNASLCIKKAEHEKLDIVKADDLYQKMQKKAEENIRVLRIIKDAIKHNRITSYYQPILNNKTGKIEKYESLVRLIDSNGNILSPYIFLNIAKIGKYYKQITQIVIEKTLKMIEKTGKEISINLSSLDIEDKTTRETLIVELRNNPTIAKNLVIELLEDESIKYEHLVKNFIKNMKLVGAKIAIDDFGSGYSNFSRIIEYEPDYIKIDASLIKNIKNNKSNVNIIEAIKMFSDRQGYKTIAEFVADEEIFEIVKSLGIDYSQGYYIGKPEPSIKK
ncbi:EAL domain-containing response regulator [Hippea maritima]|uniref:Response regulator receiver modulated diguanylate phosphodiesterase n=1 Tax=Hippea maritima (strain ATCC 700847 / DSM 10411 / MH2) TaxID=760142 RepID=F2LUT6_HIPMA|nr:EAL domain-containing protein [Hippea maritima]AEA33541.1 response regulator receiver modulated diguanylate phosphodiesterase [Hippea maritima DSM 10411]